MFNDEIGIATTLKSVCDQTYRNFEVVVINDGSTDNTETTIKEFVDERIVYYKNNINYGLTKSLNLGLGLCRFNIVVRIDSGDTCEPSRFEIQRNYFLTYKLNLLGSNAFFENIRFSYLNNWLLSKPLSLISIRYYAFFDNPFIHSSMFIDLDFLKSRNISYDDKFRANQDYDLWTRLLLIDDIEVNNLPGKLVSYNFSSKSISVLNVKAYENNFIIISNYFYKYFHFSCDYFIKAYLRYSIKRERVFFFHACLYVLIVTFLFAVINPKSFFVVCGSAFKFLIKQILKLLM